MDNTFVCFYLFSYEVKDVGETEYCRKQHNNEEENLNLYLFCNI
jgi:hypothetical protein